jgi:hypothetical protein
VRIRGVLRAVRCGRRAAGSMRLRSCDCGVRLRAQCGVRRAARGRRGVRCGARRAARCVSGLRRDVVATIAAGPATAAPAERAAACMTRATAGALPGSPPGGARAVHSAPRARASRCRVTAGLLRHGPPQAALIPRPIVKRRVWKMRGHSCRRQLRKETASE